MGIWRGTAQAKEKEKGKREIKEECGKAKEHITTKEHTDHGPLKEKGLEEKREKKGKERAKAKDVGRAAKWTIMHTNVHEAQEEKD